MQRVLLFAIGAIGSKQLLLRKQKKQVSKEAKSCLLPIAQVKKAKQNKQKEDVGAIYVAMPCLGLAIAFGTGMGTSGQPL